MDEGDVLKSLNRTLCHPKRMKIFVNTHFDSMSGKYARTDKIYIRIRKFDNQTIGVALKHPVTNDPPTEAQKVVQDKFKTVQTKVNTIMANPEQLEEYKTKWHQQHKYVTLRSFIFAKVYAETTEGE